ncbi:hypothetical protein E3N88_38813 [Mikania micrantha]|uniref:Uncharacterized protein n=1 Tax=Mikania micrantha TaxID=192012 RepID=A0A5N6LV13_9ASTR|nr:hypothetical protein E3N88_38813 [Mikania micrantha]
MPPKREPSPPQETDPATVALTTLITEQLVVVLPGINTRIRNSDEFARSFPQISARKKESEEGNDTWNKDKAHMIHESKSTDRTRCV